MIDVLERERDAHIAKARATQGKIDAAKARKIVQCNYCGRRSAIRRLVYIQTHWYVRPYSCTGGDYWKSGEGRFLCDKCGVENRLIYRDAIVALKNFFGSVIERYDDEEYGPDGRRRPTPPRKWVN